MFKKILYLIFGNKTFKKKEHSKNLAKDSLRKKKMFLISAISQSKENLSACNQNKTLLIGWLDENTIPRQILLY